MELNELKEKYASVLQLIKKKGVVLSHLHVQDGKLFMQGAAPNEAGKNLVWDEIKKVDPSYSDLTCDLTVDESLPQPAPDEVIYTVVAGDSRWKIPAKFRGGSQYFPKTSPP